MSGATAEALQRRVTELERMIDIMAERERESRAHMEKLRASMDVLQQYILKRIQNIHEDRLRDRGEMLTIIKQHTCMQERTLQQQQLVRQKIEVLITLDGHAMQGIVLLILVAYHVLKHWHQGHPLSTL